MADEREDSRQARPKDMNEVNLLQQALGPSFRTFFRVTAREPPFVDAWMCYADQTNLLQQCSDENWRADNRRGLPPRLAKLGSWVGGIKSYNTADFAVSEGAVSGYTHPGAEGMSKPAKGNLLSYERKYHEACMRGSARELEIARAREGEREEVSESVRRPKPRNDITAVLNSVVAPDPEGYLAWLTDFGHSYYSIFARRQKYLTWEDWCLFFAPTVYEGCQAKPMGSSQNFKLYIWSRRGSERSQRSLNDRPMITSEQAESGHKKRKRSLAGSDA